MNHLSTIRDIQAHGVLNEYEQALRTGNTAYAERIVTANPDLANDLAVLKRKFGPTDESR